MGQGATLNKAGKDQRVDPADGAKRGVHAPSHVKFLLALWHNKPVLAAVVFFGAVVVGPLLAPRSPIATSIQVLSPPSAVNLLGTDTLGRDVLSRILSGGGLLIGMSVAAGAGAVLIGSTVGLIAGYKGGIVDAALMRGVDLLLTLPPMLLALLVVATLPRNNVVLITLVAILLAPGAARVIRGLSQQIAGREFVAAAEAAGESTASILLREMLPNVRGRLAVEWALRTGYAILTISSLNFLGVGISPPTPDWGLMVSEERFALSIAPWATLFPALAIFFAIYVTNTLAEWLERKWQ